MGSLALRDSTPFEQSRSIRAAEANQKKENNDSVFGELLNVLDIKLSELIKTHWR